jgi:hypothetical protein
MVQRLYRAPLRREFRHRQCINRMATGGDALDHQVRVVVR